MFEIIGRFFRFCSKENRNKFYISIVLGVFNSFFLALRIFSVALILQGIIYELQGNFTFTSKTIWQSVFVMLVSLVGAIVTKRFMSMLQTEAGYRTCAQKRIEIAEHLRYLPMGYFNSNTLGYITSVATNTMESIGDVATRAIMMVMQGLLDTLLIIVMIAFFDLRIALISLVGFLLFQGINSIMRHNVRSASSEKIKSDTTLVEKILEYIQGIAEVKAYNMTGARNKDLALAIEKSIKGNISMELKCIPLTLVQSFVAKLTGCAIVLFSIYFYLNGSMELAHCAVMLVCSFMLFTALEAGGNYSALLRAIDLGVERAEKILALPTMKIDGNEFNIKEHNLNAKDVEFSYNKKSVFDSDSKPKAYKKIIDGISVNIPAKKSIAIVGPSGGGKTTFCHLLSRFWDVDSGSILLSEHDLRDFNMDNLMENFSFVFQNVYLFKDTIANNIRFGEPSAPMEKVIEAAKKACCHDFISALPNGYETVIGEGGATLSGGERQRISIARAIMKDTPIIILDEATANVDPENERDLMNAIEALTKEKTVIMIAHRLKTVRAANQIIVIAGGKIVEQGNHKSLIAQDGIYSRFVKSREQAVSWKL